MESLAIKVNTAIKEAFNSYINECVTTLSYDKDKMIDLLNSRFSNELKISPSSTTATRTPKTKSSSPPKKKKIVDETPPSTSITSVSTNVCAYIYSKGDKSGKACGKKCLDNTHCKEHLKHVGKDKTVKTVRKKSEKNEPKTDVEKLVEKASKLHQVKRNSFGNYMLSGTDYVLDGTTKKISGKQLSDGSISTLTVEDINQCKVIGIECMRPDKLVNNKEIAEEEEQVEEEEEEEEEAGEEEEEDEEED